MIINAGAGGGTGGGLKIVEIGTGTTNHNQVLSAPATLVFFLKYLGENNSVTLPIVAGEETELNGFTGTLSSDGLTLYVTYIGDTSYNYIALA